MRSCSQFRIPFAAHAFGLSVLLAFVGPAMTLAETKYTTSLSNTVTNVYGAIFPNSSPHYDAIEFEVTNNGDLLWVDQNVSFNGSSLSNVFTSTTFTSTGGRVSASLLGTDTFISPVNGRTFIVQNFALNNVDLTTSSGATGDVELRIQGLAGGDTVLSLNNSTLSSTLIPHFYVPSALSFQVSGNSQIDGWKGHVASTTALTVASGGTLRIKDSGDLVSIADSNKLFFNQQANTANLVGSALILENSAVVFGANPFGDPSKESTLTFNSGASLELTGSSGTTSLKTDNLVFHNSSLNLANHHAQLTLRNKLTLDESSATLAGAAHADTFHLDVIGSSVISMGTNASLTTSGVELTAGSTLTINGIGDDIAEMTVNGPIVFPASGTGSLVVGNSLAVLNLRQTGVTDLTSQANLTNNGLIDLQDSSKLIVRDGATFTNNGQLAVHTGTLSIVGDATIGQASGNNGLLDVNGALTFADAPNKGANTLNTSNQLALGSNSVLHMFINPLAQTSDRILIDNGAQEFTINSSAQLQLHVDNDALLPFGTKFLLIDYPDRQVEMLAYFRHLPDQTIFKLGLNRYQINYNDGAYRPADGSTFITLTTVPVPEPSTFGLFATGAALAWVMQKRRGNR